MKNAELFRVIFENSTVGKSLTAPDGQMLQINTTFAGMLGYTIEEIQQINFAQITHPDDIAKSQESIRSLLADEQIIYQMEKRYIHKNGDIVWANVSTTLLRDEHRSPLYLITNIVDITERKRSELQREALLEEINKLNAELEHRVAQRTAELSAKTAELEKINKVFVDRELRMRELKERIAELEGIKDVNGEM